MSAIKPPFQYFGGKTRIAQQIADLLPAHEHYVEPFAGSLSVLLAKRPSPMETVNDLAGDIVAFWRVLRERPDDLERVCALTPHSRAEHQLSYEPAEDDLERARRTWVRLTQGRSGQLRQRTGWRFHAKPASTGLPAYLSAYVARLHPAAQRLARVSIECRPALEVIRAYGQHPGTLIYADPPYPDCVRHHAGFGDVYVHEMRGDDSHRELAEALRSCRGGGRALRVRLRALRRAVRRLAPPRAERLHRQRPARRGPAGRGPVVQSAVPPGDTLRRDRSGRGVMTALSGESPWRLSWRADPATRAIADRHYNRQKPGAAQFVPPGRCLVLKAADGSAAWITSWPFAEYVRHAWAGAWVNSLFRNEGGNLSSDLIRWAVAHTRAVWPTAPDLGIVSFVDPAKTAPKEVPGWCYRRAGWSHVGSTQGGLLAFQQLPGTRIGRRSEPMPEAVLVPGWQPSLFELEAS